MLVPEVTEQDVRNALRDWNGFHISHMPARGM